MITPHVLNTAVQEDGILISNSVLDKLNFRLYDHRVVDFGPNPYPLNLYGNDDYKEPHATHTS